MSTVKEFAAGQWQLETICHWPLIKNDYIYWIDPTQNLFCSLHCRNEQLLNLNGKHSIFSNIKHSQNVLILSFYIKMLFHQNYLGTFFKRWNFYNHKTNWNIKKIIRSNKAEQSVKKSNSWRIFMFINLAYS